MKICAKCGAENLDFKIYCGECGAALSEASSEESIPKMADQDLEQCSVPETRNVLTRIRTSPITGIIMMILPIPFSCCSIDLIISLSMIELVSPGWLYFALLMIVIEVMFLFGNLIFNREYRLAYVEPPFRGILVFLLTSSIAPYIILVMTSLIGHFGTEYSVSIFLVSLAFFSWLLFFGWLGESQPEKALKKETS
jgi:hypothetical protein